jgi:ABC-type glycerol-3-phosphate transport system permease component
VSVRRKGPRATLVRVVTYALLVAVAAVVVFPFVVAVSTAFKSNQDIFVYPPSLVPKQDATVDAEAVGETGDPLPLYEVPGRGGEWALVNGSASLAEYRPLGVVERTITLEAGTATETGETVTIDGEEEDVYDVPVEDGTVRAYRLRTTIGGIFRSVDDPSVEVASLINAAEPAKEFGPRVENFSEVVDDKDLGRSLTNTLLVTIAVVAGQILTSILGGYAFARIEFRGRSSLFLLYLGATTSSR